LSSSLVLNQKKGGIEAKEVEAKLVIFSLKVLKLTNAKIFK
jgi:hypothetical protein